MKNRSILLFIGVFVLILSIIFLVDKLFDRNKLYTDDELVKSKEAKVILNLTDKYAEYAEIKTDTEELEVTTSRYIREEELERLDPEYEPKSKTIDLEGNEVIYIYSDYYQSSATVVIYVLTKNGKLYSNEYTLGDKAYDSLDNFKLINQEVWNLVKKKNDNYKKVSEAGIPDNKEYHLYAEINDELVLVNNQYNG